jgi:hypothetical protein
MTQAKAIYKLEKILDNPKYEGFGMGEQPSLCGKGERYNDFDWDFDEKLGQWIAPQLSATWKPLRVIGRVRPFNDFPCLALSYPVFSQRSVDVLRDLLEPNGELLPVITSVGSYFLYNCTTVADIIDFQKSKLSYTNEHTVSMIYHLEVHGNSLSGSSIFNMKKYPGMCFVTDAMARRIREAKLEGFEFRKVWPLPEHIFHMLHHKHPECRDELTAQPEAEARPIKGNAIVLRLILEEDQPSVVEQSRFEKIADELDKLLVNPRKNARYFGNLEIAEFAAGEARFFFSCPDADDLAKKLKPWVKALDWQGEKFLTKRYGEFVDAEATEVHVKLK